MGDFESVPLQAETISHGACLRWPACDPDSRRLWQLSSALPKLAQLLLNSSDVQILGDVCWCFSYLSDDDSEQGAFIKAVVAANVCGRLVDLLSSSNFSIQTTALRCVGNIVTGDDSDTQACADTSRRGHVETCL